MVLAFVLSSASAYQRHQTTSALADLSEATSTLVNHLSTQELALVDNLGIKHEFIIDPSKLQGLSFSQELGGENFEFWVEVSLQEGKSFTHGPTPPLDQPTCSIEVACAIWAEGRPLLGKLRVVVWRA